MNICLSLMLLRMIARLAVRQLCAAVIILSEINSKGAHCLITYFKFGVIGIFAPLVLWEQIGIISVSMTVGGYTFVRLCIILSDVLKCTGSRSIFSAWGSSLTVIIESHNDSIKIHLWNICGGNILGIDDILIFIKLRYIISLGFSETIEVVVCVYNQSVCFIKNRIVISVKFDITLFCVFFVINNLDLFAVHLNRCKSFDSEILKKLFLCKWQWSIFVIFKNFVLIAIKIESDNFSVFLFRQQNCFCSIGITWIFTAEHNIIHSFKLINKILIDHKLSGMESGFFLAVLFIRNIGDYLHIVENRNSIIPEFRTVHKISVIRYADDSFIFIGGNTAVLRCFLNIIIENMCIYTKIWAINMESCITCFFLILHKFMQRSNNGICR